MLTPEARELLGCVAVTFEGEAAAESCASSLNGRWFDGSGAPSASGLVLTLVNCSSVSPALAGTACSPDTVLPAPRRASASALI